MNVNDRTDNSSFSRIFLVFLDQQFEFDIIENLRKGRKPRTSVRKFSIPKMCPSKVRAR